MRQLPRRYVFNQLWEYVKYRLLNLRFWYLLIGWRVRVRIVPGRNLPRQLGRIKLYFVHRGELSSQYIQNVVFIL